MASFATTPTRGTQKQVPATPPQPPTARLDLASKSPPTPAAPTPERALRGNSKATSTGTSKTTTRPHYIDRARFKHLRDKRGSKATGKDWSHIVSWEVYNKGIAPHIKGRGYSTSTKKTVATFLQKSDQPGGSNGRIKTRSGTKYANVGKRGSSDQALDREIIAAMDAADGRHLSKDASKRAARQWQRISRQGGVLPDGMLKASRRLYASLKNEFGAAITRKNAALERPDGTPYVLDSGTATKGQESRHSKEAATKEKAPVAKLKKATTTVTTKVEAHHSKQQETPVAPKPKATKRATKSGDAAKKGGKTRQQTRASDASKGNRCVVASPR